MPFPWSTPSGPGSGSAYLADSTLNPFPEYDRVRRLQRSPHYTGQST
jgi:hypothetical protein